MAKHMWWMAAAAAITVVTAGCGSASEEAPTAPSSASMVVPSKDLTQQEMRFLSMLDKNPAFNGDDGTKIQAGRNVCAEMETNGVSDTLEWLTDEVGWSYDAAVDLMYAAGQTLC